MNEEDIEQLRSERARLEMALQLQRAADETIERAMRDRLNLSAVLEEMFQLLAGHLGASYGWVRTFDDTLELRDFQWQADPSARTPIWTSILLESLVQLPGEIFRGVVDDRRTVAMRLEVAGIDFGLAAVMWEGPLEPEDATLNDDLAGLFEGWCEVLDNHLAAHAEARRKQQILGKLSEALRNPILDEGLADALRVLADYVQLTGLAVIYNPDGRPDSTHVQYVVLDSEGETSTDPEFNATTRHLAEHGLAALHGDVEGLRHSLGEGRGFDDVLVSGLTEGAVVGRIVAAVEQRELSTHDHELFVRFSDNLRQRLVDFNREYQRLAHSFSDSDVHRLLHEQDYRQRLTPREENVAALYTDIAGFTRISEQVLKEPTLIGKLVDLWGDEVVRIIWEEGGTFDKMVGDCVIGLFGPPFFEIEAKAGCEAAIRAAKRIEEFTRELHAHESLPELAAMKGELGVATGINYCSMFVGRFGPDEDYTGFSSGMNNTARLQGVAIRGEILVMDSVVEELGGVDAEWREAKVKNVEAPLRFKAIPVDDGE
ncbi:MAG: adenylate/guanylate cyclase domain-containing protein [Myxococcota bacterium]